MEANLKKFQNQYVDFISDRGWDEFHTPKNFTMVISVEVSELMELYQWKDNVPNNHHQADKDLVGRSREEVADTVIY